MIIRASLLLILGAAYFLLAACNSTSSDSRITRDPDIALQDYSLIAQFDKVADQQEVEVVATLYKDAESVAFVGGDYFQVFSVDKDRSQAVLLKPSHWENTYTAILAWDETENPQNAIHIQTVYEPEMAREQRWYPAEKLMHDVGFNPDIIELSQSFTFPSQIRLTLPERESVKVYSEADDLVEVSWDVGSDNSAKIQIYPLADCKDNQGQSYVYSPFDIYSEKRLSEMGLIVDDAGTASFEASVVKPVFEKKTTNDYLGDFVAAFYKVTTMGLVKFDKDDFSFGTLDYCKVKVFVSRLYVRKGETLVELIPALANGNVTLSTTDTFRFNYRPATED